MTGWVGYGYEWNEAQTEATIAPDAIATWASMFNTGTRTVTWNYPSRMDCIKCHDPLGRLDAGARDGADEPHRGRRRTRSTRSRR